ncbi:MAG: cytochrome c [Actinomycetota bacterium]|nr:cytochrome c [Actinomycetota bacterium]
MIRPRPLALSLLVLAGAGVTACGKEGIHLEAKHGDTPQIKHGAQLFAARCGGCHTLKAAGTQGSATRVNDRERTDGPNFDQRSESLQGVLYAIRNGGFSGAIMPQNIAVGRDAQAVAEFVSRYAGKAKTSTAG